MRIKSVRAFGKWACCVLVLTGLGYSFEVLMARPVHAGPTCTDADCDVIEINFAHYVCSTHGGVRQVTCPTTPDQYTILCNDGTLTNGTCAS